MESKYPVFKFEDVPAVLESSDETAVDSLEASHEASSTSQAINAIILSTDLSTESSDDVLDEFAPEQHQEAADPHLSRPHFLVDTHGESDLTMTSEEADSLLSSRYRIPHEYSSVC